MTTSGSTIGDASYVALLRRLAFEPEVRGAWAHVGHADGMQGWKLHLSSTPRDAGTLLRCVLPVLRRTAAAFKVARDAVTLAALNDGERGATQVGKFVTIYPPCDEACRQLAAELVAVTAGRIGPIVRTDLRLGDVVYARYGSINPIVGTDRLGRTVIAIRSADGDFVADHYRIPFVPPPDIDNPFAAWPLAGARASAPSAPSRRLGPGYLVLGVVEDHPKGTVFYGLDVRRQGTPSSKILKQGRQHCLADAHGRDIRDRLRHQEALHEKLFGFVPIPKADPYFEVDGDGYLALELIDGETIEHAALRALGGRAWASLPVAGRRRLLGLFQQLVVAVQRLHARGIAHRELNACNVWVAKDDTVYLLDLELAHALDDPSPPFGPGTPGFMSPQQAAGQPPSFADDVFALGALCLLTLTGIDPRRLLGAGRDRTSRWQALAGRGADALVACASRCVSDDPALRPSLDDILRAVARELGALGSEAALAGGARRHETRSRRGELRDLAASGIRGICQDAPRDERTGLWLSAAFEGEIGAGRRDAYTVEYDAHRGIAGVVYGLARAARIGLLDDAARADARRALQVLLDDAPSELTPLPGLHFGTAGIAVAVAEAASVGVVDASAALTSFVTRALRGDLDWPDLTHGAAGQGMAALLCADRLGDPEIAALAHRAADYLIATQRDDGSWVLPPGVDGLSGETLTGFAHGTSGIVYFLIEYARRFRVATATAAWRAGAAWIAGKALEARGGEALEWPDRVDRPGRSRFWCHGGPGIALMWLRAWQATREDRFAMLARRALAIHPRDFRHSNLGQCHGLSGLGEIYLEAWRVLGDGEFHDRASEIATVLSCLAQTSSGGATRWLVEDPYLPCADLMVGTSGVVHFLLRHAEPESGMGPPLLSPGSEDRFPGDDER